jgi:hypothetical protein
MYIFRLKPFRILNSSEFRNRMTSVVFKTIVERELKNYLKKKFKFYVYGSIHCWSILIIVQRDATQNSLFIILQVHSTCFGCQPHSSSGVHKTVTTAFGTGHIFVQLPLSSVVKLPHWRKVAAQKNITSTGGCSYSFV